MGIVHVGAGVVECGGLNVDFWNIEKCIFAVREI